MGGTNPSPPCLEVTCGLRPLFCLRTAPPLTLLPCQLFFCFLPNFFAAAPSFSPQPPNHPAFSRWHAFGLQNQPNRLIYKDRGVSLYFSSISPMLPFSQKIQLLEIHPQKRKVQKRESAGPQVQNRGGSVWAEAEAIALKSGNN